MKKNPIDKNNLTSNHYVDQQIGKLFTGNSPAVCRKPKYSKQHFNSYHYL